MSLYKHDKFEMEYQLIQTFPYIMLSLNTKVPLLQSLLKFTLYFYLNADKFKLGANAIKN